MAVSEAILNQNTNSVTFTEALPALLRAADASDNGKTMFFVLLRYWMLFLEERKNAKKPNEDRTDLFLKAAFEMARSKKERDAVEVISHNWRHFAPTEYLLGFM